MRWKKRQNVGQKRAIKENDSDIGDRREKERERMLCNEIMQDNMVRRWGCLR